MAKVKGTKKRTRAKHKKPGSKRGRGVKKSWIYRLWTMIHFSLDIPFKVD